MATYQDIIYTLENYGFTDVMLPFLLIFTIIFAVLQKAKILGDKKNFNVVVSLVISLSVVIPHVTGRYPAGYDAVNIINSALPSVSILAVAAIAFLILVGVFGAEYRWIGQSLSGWMAIIAFIFIVSIFSSAAGWTGTFFIEDYIDSDTLTLITIILVFGVIVWFITKEPSKGDSMAKMGKTLEGIGDFFGKGSGK